MQIISHKLTTVDGEYYNLRLSAPVDPDQKLDQFQPIILCLPAMGVPARKYLPLAQSLNNNGFISAIFELRGIESSSVRASRRSNFGYNQILSIDLPEAIRFIRLHYPENPLYLLGHSLGGQLALLYMSINPHEISGLIGIATGSPYFKGWHFPYNIGIYFLSKFMPLIAFFMGYFPGRKLRFGGRESHQLAKDWAHSVRTGRYVAAGHQDDLEDNIRQLTKKALFITLDNDFLAPPASSRNMGDKLVKGQVNYLHLDKSDYEKDWLGHFNWMYEPEPISQKIKDWLQKINNSTSAK